MYEKTINEPVDYFDGLANNNDARNYQKTPNFTKLYFNEKFDIFGVSSMEEALHNAYIHGLPYPMLSVLEYFSLNQDAFDWGRHYRVAGHYTHAAMYLSISFWALAVLFLCFVPHYYAMSLLGCGLSSIGGVLIYLLISPTELSIAFVGEDGHRTVMDMKFGWCFYLVIAEAFLSMAIGLLLMVLQHYKMYTLSTFLDSALDETVGPRKRRENSDNKLCGEDLANSLDVMRRCKPSTDGSNDSEKQSSGIHSRSSYTDTASLRSSASFESVKSLTRSASNLTIHDETPQRKEVTLEVEKL